MNGTPMTMDRWRAVAAATGAADREAAEDGVRRAYRTAGLAAPERIVWADSPRAAVTLVRELTDAVLGRSVRDEIRTRPWAEERRRVHDELGPRGWTALWSSTGAPLWDTTRALADRIRAAVVEDLAGGGASGGATGEAGAVRHVLLDAVLGQHDAAWLAAFDGRGERLAGLAAVAEHAGWWWPYEKVAVVCERPVELHRDEAGRLDRGDGPALAYPDGFALYAWRGMAVPAEFLAELGGLTPERIRAEENAELRRVMLEFYGYERYLAESGAQPVHRDETGVLWRIELVDDEDVAMVEVVNATPEPDGTFRTYWLRVPPRTRTAREGVAWTFGLAEEAYEPLVQT
ncbi:hypothetical protein Q5762_16855 [Streptomyces sp. P9(2023)]|uniref:DUF6745 domain-containing protein n=1 Tax=Streptomyces sp. P9(2023) TaxID=3064394 RepID=UPI0028F3F6C8|nr:hypothetical protein [Streptomyces sp. P9(2023)]MDT9689983.1 hypothetical protein [Streptomyces sp. P9(2023)]